MEAPRDEELKSWPREIFGHRRSGYPEAAEELRAKLGRLKNPRKITRRRAYKDGRDGGDISTITAIHQST